MNKSPLIFALLILGPAVFLFCHFRGATDTAPIGKAPVPSPVVPRLEPAVITPVIMPADPTDDRKSAESPPASAKSPAAAEADDRIIKLAVPFTAQAPFGEWSDPRQQNACEEASALMAVAWARGEKFTQEEAKERILAMADWQQDKYGSFQDTSASDTVERIFKGYFEYRQAQIAENVTIQDIIAELAKGNLVIVPANGQALKNKNFRQPGPREHMLVIIGYDYGAKEFIANDPGTRQGKGYRYQQDVLFSAIRDYPTGFRQPIIGIKKTMIVVKK